jgi:adenylyl cyclase-associated protein
MHAQGEAVTSGLKKVTDDMKTKNRAERTGVVSSSAGAAAGVALHAALGCCSTCA